MIKADLVELLRGSGWISTDELFQRSDYADKVEMNVKLGRLEGAGQVRFRSGQFGREVCRVGEEGASALPPRASSRDPQPVGPAPAAHKSPPVDLRSSQPEAMRIVKARFLELLSKGPIRGADAILSIGTSQGAFSLCTRALERSYEIESTGLLKSSKVWRLRSEREAPPLKIPAARVDAKIEANDSSAEREVEPPQRSSAAAAPLVSEATATSMLITDARFALWSDGRLEIDAGDDSMVLSKESTRRLIGYLDSLSQISEAAAATL